MPYQLQTSPLAIEEELLERMLDELGAIDEELGAIDDELGAIDEELRGIDEDDTELLERTLLLAVPLKLVASLEVALIPLVLLIR